MSENENLFPQICSFSNLSSAALKASKGKKKSIEVQNFLFNLEYEILGLEKQLLEGRYRPQAFTVITVRDPKVRNICAPAFRDRVVHHAICNFLEPIFERNYIFDTYACRRGKGTHRAIRRAQIFCRRNTYYLKLDIHKFFDTIDHVILKELLARRIKENDLRNCLNNLISQSVPWTEENKGLPIGSLTSQHFANFYLSGLDHFIKEKLRIPGYVRYMDDMVLFAEKKVILNQVKLEIDLYLKEKLHLEFRPDATLLAPIKQGLPFLGFRIFHGVIRIDRRGWRRFRKKVNRRRQELESGSIGHECWSRSMASLVGHLQQANTRNLRANFFNGQGQKEARTV